MSGKVTLLAKANFRGPLCEREFTPYRLILSNLQKRCFTHPDRHARLFSRTADPTAPGGRAWTIDPPQFLSRLSLI